LKSSAFSYSGLKEQLEYEGFTEDESQYGVDNCSADWEEQAAKKAKSYLRHSDYSKSRLIDQLKYEGFTYEQAVYGVEQAGL
jgi:SOS response regulatory protein OraA/RecX